MSDDYHPRKLFTLDEANAALPLVRAIAGDLASLARDLTERQQRLAMLRGNRSRDARDPYSEELTEMERELERETRQLRVYVEELHSLGVEPKNAIEGLIDFPSIRDGRVVYLCWKLDEPKVRFWHELEAGFQGRQPLEDSPSEVSEPSGASPGA